MQSVIYEVTKLLEEDEVLVSEVAKLSHELDVPWGTLRPIFQSYKFGHTSPFLLLDAILTQWWSQRGRAATIGKLCEALEAIDLKQSAENLKSVFPNYVIVAKSRVDRLPIFGLKPVVANFTGRSAELAELNDAFENGEPVVVIHGRGGIGKTELAKKFVIGIGANDEHMRIVKSWFGGETAALLGHHVAKFCHDLGLNDIDMVGKVSKIEELIDRIFTRLMKLGDIKWVIVIDNVDQLYTEAENTLLQLSKLENVFLIVTSRRRDIFPTASRILPLNSLELGESVLLAKAMLKWEGRECEEVLTTLCNTLGNFPLAINQACGYICQMRESSSKGDAYGVRDYLDEIGKPLKHSLANSSDILDYPHTMLKIWNCSFDRLQNKFGETGKVALNVLNILAFINPDGIKIKFIGKLYLKFYSCEIGSEVLEDSLTVLLRYSLVASCNNVTSINRIVQTAVRERMSQSKKDVEILSQFWADFDAKEWSKSEMLSIIKLWVHSSQIEELAEYREVHLSGLIKELERLKLFDASSGRTSKILGSGAQQLMEIDEKLETFLEAEELQVKPFGSIRPSFPVRLLDTWTIPDISNILVQHVMVIREWYAVAEEMGLPLAKLKGNINRFKLGNIPFSTIIEETLELWISKHGKDASLQRLCEILESSELKNAAEAVKTRWSVGAELNKRDTIYSPEIASPEPLENLPLVRAKTFQAKENVYRCPRHKPLGFVLVLNTFNTKNIHRRQPTVPITYNLLQLFEELSYTVVLAYDFIRETDDLPKHVKHFKEMLNTAKEGIGSVVIVCCSHSKSGMFFNRNHNKDFENSVVDLFQSNECPILKGVPKIFIFESYCEETILQPLEDEPSRRLGWKDTILCYPPANHLGVYRNNIIGSWFMYCFIKTVKKHAHEYDLLQILDKVQWELCATEKQNQMLPKYVPHSLVYEIFQFSKKFYFNTVLPFEETDYFKQKHSTEID